MAGFHKSMNQLNQLSAQQQADAEAELNALQQKLDENDGQS